MKRLIIIVEGQTEEEFVKALLIPYFNSKHIYDIVPIKIATSNTSKGGFVNYQHLKNDIHKRIKEDNVIISMFVDFFRIPTNIPDYTTCMTKATINDRIVALEQAILKDINAFNFIPYIQKHEFEALLFSSNTGFEKLYEEAKYKQTEMIVNSYPNPEEINTQPLTAPAKRLETIMGSYQKIYEGNMIALEIGIEKIIEKCPRFKNWIEKLIMAVSKI